jgi:putative DNA primase/helicase
MGQVALQYVRRGWPVFPCRECDGAPYKKRSTGEMATPRAKAPYTGTGLKDATTDEQRINAWWRSYPNALIGLPAGENGCFVVDFDPRWVEDHDPATGEVLVDEDGKPILRLLTLVELKAALEEQMGCPLPRSLTAITPSGGVHVYFRQPADGEEIRNKGNLPDHVDVRGRGGYVIAPPSEILDPVEFASTGQYRWLDRGDWRDDAAIMEAPAELIAILRAPKQSTRPATPRSLSPATGSAERRPINTDDPVERARVAWARAALDNEISSAERLQQGKRNDGISAAAIRLGAIVGAGYLSESLVKGALYSVAELWPDVAKTQRSIDTGLVKGIGTPRDMADIGAEAGRYAPRQSGAARAPTPPAQRSPSQSFQSGSVEADEGLAEGDRTRFEKASAAWLTRRIKYLDPSKDAVLRLAFSAGRRIAIKLLDINAVKEILWAEYEAIADVQHEDVDRAIEDGIARGFDLSALMLTQKCGKYPMTDFGIAERFRDRVGANFRFTTTKGWLGWDERRWKVLDQDEKTPPAEVIAAVFETVRAIQEEARFVADTGVRWELKRSGKEQELDLETEDNPHGLDHWIPKGKSFELLSTKIAIFGRQAETAGKPVAIANLARRWLTVPIEAFDHEPYAFNVMNGTLRFSRELLHDGSYAVSVGLTDHAREDMLTKLAPVEYDPQATSPLYDGMFGWAQPDAGVRRYLHQVGGYALTADAGEQKLWFWYGRGRNGKGVTMESWSHVAGDYSDSIPIGSFLDQGIKKRGDAASPDLAKLGGVRMLRASEPGRNEKLDSALIKLVTGGEPIAVRMLHRGFFNLVPLFKLIIQGNTKFDIPDTDDGIWGRLKLIAWLRNIDIPEEGVANWPVKDKDLATKIKANEGSGVLNHLIAGLCDYLANGFVEPKSVTEATAAYRDASDPIARFLRMCTEPDDKGKVQSSRLHEVFVAWAKATGEQGQREWSNKSFSKAMTEKGYQTSRSNGMQWAGLRLIREVHDFVDSDGKVIAMEDRDDLVLDSARPPPMTFYDDDMPP